jgi:hypothetical protein
MSAPVVIDAPLNLEPVGPDSSIVDLEPRSPDAQARPSELVQAAVTPKRRATTEPRSLAVGPICTLAARLKFRGADSCGMSIRSERIHESVQRGQFVPA